MIISASLTFTEVMFPAARIQGAKLHEVDARYVTTFDLIQVQGETASYTHCSRRQVVPRMSIAPIEY